MSWREIFPNRLFSIDNIDTKTYVSFVYIVYIEKWIYLFFKHLAKLINFKPARIQILKLKLIVLIQLVILPVLYTNKLPKIIYPWIYILFYQIKYRKILLGCTYEKNVYFCQNIKCVLGTSDLVQVVPKNE